MTGTDFDPARMFWIANEWYWRITENTGTLTLEEAARDFVRPLMRLLDRGVEVVIEGAGLAIRFGTHHVRLPVATNVSDRVAVDHLIADLDRMLATAQLAQTFAIVVPRRYELCGVLLAKAELDRLWGDPRLLVPSSRALVERVS
ncbi:MAG: hypothetical protein ABJE66_16210 [Deltaproteobacteria bacterium]